jgi:hypothetical protein
VLDEAFERKPEDHPAFLGRVWGPEDSHTNRETYEIQ